MGEGIISRISKGFGFIKAHQDNKDYFFRAANVVSGHDFSQLSSGESVSFDLRPNPARPGEQWAVNVRPTDMAVPARPEGVRREQHRRSRLAPAVAGPRPAATKRLLPYTFVRVDTDAAIHAPPVWHDGSGGGDLLSGELRCTLTALTPLLPGNVRYTVAEADKGKLRLPDDLSGEKQIAEPLRLPDGRVIIGGSALKGMVRLSLGALFSAPMERVTEHHYTYRPNLDFSRNRQKYEVKPALVVEKADGGWDIEIFSDARSALFVCREVEDDITASAKNGIVAGRIKGIVQPVHVGKGGRRVHRLHICKGSSSDSVDLNHRLAIYRGGLDGQGLAAAAFGKAHEGRGAFTYELALVPAERGRFSHIPAELYERYLCDQTNVLSNDVTGHLAAHSLEMDTGMVQSCIRRHAELQPGQLIYVEVEARTKHPSTGDFEILSLGHHFRYRWAYTSSIRKKNGKQRSCLSPTALERVPAGREGEPDVAPEQLTGARLLFGYVRDDEKLPIGKGVYERLAGRIAINHAVSDEVPHFLGDHESGYCVPLKILGQPKPSAWEFYLLQPRSTDEPPTTYGDLPREAGGDLSGRKFYRHWPGTTLDKIKAKDRKTVESKQATLGRFICAPGTTFKFAIRFSRLRDWELGALLVVLQPHLLKEDGNPEDYALKLGLGRPLGMGSVRIQVDKMLVRAERECMLAEPTNQIEANNPCIAEFRRKISTQDHSAWANAHNYGNALPLAYPTDETPKEGHQIYAWHTNVRREYSKLRREDQANWSVLRKKIKDGEGGSNPEKGY